MGITVWDRTVLEGSGLEDAILFENSERIGAVESLDVPEGVTGEICDSSVMTDAAYRISWASPAVGSYTLRYRVTPQDGEGSEEVSIAVSVLSEADAATSPFIDGEVAVNVVRSASAIYGAIGGTYDDAEWTVIDLSGTVTSYETDGAGIYLMLDRETSGGTVTLSVTNDQGGTAEMTVLVRNQEQDVGTRNLTTDVSVSGDTRVKGRRTLTLTATASGGDKSDVIWDVEAPDLMMIVGTSKTDTGGTVTLLASQVELDTTVGVTATAADGSGVAQTFAVTVQGETIILDANGGTFPDGSSQVELEPEDGYMLLPDWSVVDRSGYRLTGWTSDSGASGSMGEQVEAGGTWTAVWTRDTRSYDTSHLPHAAIRIYRALDQYIDATYLQVEGGQASVTLAENEAGSATFTLLNDYRTTGRNLMSSSCSLWSSGSNGAISPGMYVRIDNINSDGTLEYVTDGFITTISPDAETVAIEIGDRMTFLGKQGTTLRRNYYGGAGSRSSVFVSAGYDSENGLYADLSELPDGAVVDGSIYWTVPASRSYSRSTYWDLTYVSSTVPLFVYTFVPPGEYIDTLELVLAIVSFHTATTHTFTFEVSSGGNTQTHTYTTTDIYNSSFTVSLDLGMMQCGSTVTVTCYVNNSVTNGNYRVYCVSSDTDVISIYTSSTTYVDRSYSIAGSVTAYTLALAEGSTTGERFYPTDISGQSLDDSDLYTPSENRVYVPYVISGTQSTVDVMEGIAWAMEMIPMANTTALAREETLVTIFRTGGGYALDYLQKLADIGSDDNRMRTFRARGYTTPVIAIGTRYVKTDSSHYHIHYGGDSVSSGGTRIAFSDFSPSMTMKNRPSLATLRGTLSEQSSSESYPLQIAVEDVESTNARFGILVETVVSSSSVTDLGDAGQAAWAELAESDLDQWEGSISIPDAYTSMLAQSGAYVGSGVPIRITDTRNGLSSYQARVRQVAVNYNTCLTTLTISNYSLAYSSGLDDTTVLAIVATDVATGDVDTTLYNCQYVRVKTDVDQNLGDGTQVTMTGIKEGGTFEFSKVAVFALPNGRHLVHGMALADDDGHTGDSEVYGVIAVRIGDNDQLDIRQSIRPDWYRGQTLSVDIDCP